MVSSDAQAACEFVRSKPLSDCPYSGFSACGYAADNPKAVPFAAALSNPKSGNRRAGAAAGLAHALAPIDRPQPGNKPSPAVFLEPGKGPIWQGFGPALSGPKWSYLTGLSWLHKMGCPECVGSSMSKGGIFTALAASAILLSVVSLAPLDARAEEPGRPKTTGYPAVEDVPPRPEKPAMTADEQLKLKKELSATRDRQTAAGKARGGAARVGPLKP
jgi:hypothetical protein